MKKASIYTRTGDGGSSALFNGERKAKSNLVFVALGAVDELNSALGIALLYCHRAGNGLDDQLFKIQCILFDIGSNIATPRLGSDESLLEMTAFDKEGLLVAELEEWIDSLDAKLPKLTKFILPAGNESGVFLHQARSICRRAERDVVTVVEDAPGSVDASVLRYLNRLSDYLFVAARIACQAEGVEETLYKKQVGPIKRSLQKE